MRNLGGNRGDYIDEGRPKRTSFRSEFHVYLRPKNDAGNTRARGNNRSDLKNGRTNPVSKWVDFAVNPLCANRFACFESCGHGLSAAGSDQGLAAEGFRQTNPNRACSSPRIEQTNPMLDRSAAHIEQTNPRVVPLSARIQQTNPKMRKVCGWYGFSSPFDVAGADGDETSERTQC